MENEYASMVEILSGHGEDEIIDTAKLANNGESPITYADVEEFKLADQDSDGRKRIGFTLPGKEK